MMDDCLIEADPDCEHADFDIMGRCVRCGRDFSEQRDAGRISRAQVDRQEQAMDAAMREHPDEFPSCRLVQLRD